MNRELFEKIAQWLEAGAPHEPGGIGFNMAYTYCDDCSNHAEQEWNQGCGTVMCIAGAALVFDPDTKDTASHISDMDETEGYARRNLGISEEDADALFYPDFSPDRYYGRDESMNYYHMITPQQAAETIRHYMDTGEVKWRKPTVKLDT